MGENQIGTRTIKMSLREVRGCLGRVQSTMK